MSTPKKTPSMADRAKLGASITSRVEVGGRERRARAAARARSTAGRPPIWPEGTRTVRVSIRLPSSLVKALRVIALNEGQDWTRLSGEALAEFARKCGADPGSWGAQ